MKRILVVANETVAGRPLIDAVKRHAEQGEVEVHVICPQNQPKHGYVIYESHGPRRDREPAEDDAWRSCARPASRPTAR